MNDPEPRVFTDDIPQDQIEVHWQHPRTELELPLLLVWPSPAIDEWAAVVENGTASGSSLSRTTSVNSSTTGSRASAATSRTNAVGSLS